MTASFPSDRELVEKFLTLVEKGVYSPEAWAEHVAEEFGEPILKGRRIRQMREEGWSRINTETRVKLLRYFGYLSEEAGGGREEPPPDGD